MGKILKLYQSNFLIRYDKDGIIPYLGVGDFPGLSVTEGSFVNAEGHKISYFFYQQEGFREDKLVLFLHGIGPGHTAYMSEIAALCAHGYRVLTLDYTGCGASEGERLDSLNRPTKDVDELLSHLSPKEEILVVGHSLGGYTALNTVRRHKEIRRAVVLSGFYSVKSELCALMKLAPLTWPALRYERRACPGYENDGNLAYLRTSEDRILWIHSTDDAMVPFASAMGAIRKKVKNDHISFVPVTGKGHNPNYTAEALAYMNGVFGDYGARVKSGELDTFEKKQAYMADKSAAKMTVQDGEVWARIFAFLDEA